MSAPSPPSSAPSTVSEVVVPQTGLGLAAAAVATVGGALTAVTFQLPLAEPASAPEAALTVKLLAPLAPAGDVTATERVAEAPGASVSLHPAGEAAKPAGTLELTMKVPLEQPLESVLRTVTE